MIVTPRVGCCGLDRITVPPRVGCCDLVLTVLPLCGGRVTRTVLGRLITFGLGAGAVERVVVERFVLGRAVLGRDRVVDLWVPELTRAVLGRVTRRVVFDVWASAGAAMASTQATPRVIASARYPLSMLAS